MGIIRELRDIYFTINIKFVFFRKCSVALDIKMNISREFDHLFWNFWLPKVIHFHNYVLSISFFSFIFYFEFPPTHSQYTTESIIISLSLLDTNFHTNYTYIFDKKKTCPKNDPLQNSYNAACHSPQKKNGKGNWKLNSRISRSYLAMEKIQQLTMIQLVKRTGNNKWTYYSTRTRISSEINW